MVIYTYILDLFIYSHFYAIEPTSTTLTRTNCLSQSIHLHPTTGGRGGRGLGTGIITRSPTHHSLWSPIFYYYLLLLLLGPSPSPTNNNKQTQTISCYRTMVTMIATMTIIITIIPIITTTILRIWMCPYYRLLLVPDHCQSPFHFVSILFSFHEMVGDYSIKFIF